MASILTVALPTCAFKGYQLHKPKTIVIQMCGHGAASKTNPSFLASALHGPAGVPLGGIEDLYRFQNPTRWYLNLANSVSDNVYESLHGQNIYLKTGDVSMRLEHIEKERTRITLNWLPNTIEKEYVQSIVKDATGDSKAEVFPLLNKTGQWGALCTPVQEIPHYLRIQSSVITTPNHLVMVAVPGRRTACLTCQSTEHWSNRCPRRWSSKEDASQPARRTGRTPTAADCPPLPRDTTRTEISSEIMFQEADFPPLERKTSSPEKAADTSPLVRETAKTAAPTNSRARKSATTANMSINNLQTDREATRTTMATVSQTPEMELTNTVMTPDFPPTDKEASTIIAEDFALLEIESRKPDMAANYSLERGTERNNKETDLPLLVGEASELNTPADFPSTEKEATKTTISGNPELLGEEPTTALATDASCENTATTKPQTGNQTTWETQPKQQPTKDKTQPKQKPKQEKCVKKKPNKHKREIHEGTKSSDKSSEEDLSPYKAPPTPKKRQTAPTPKKRQTATTSRRMEEEINDTDTDFLKDPANYGPTLADYTDESSTDDEETNLPQ